MQVDYTCYYHYKVMGGCSTKSTNVNGFDSISKYFAVNYVLSN